MLAHADVAHNGRLNAHLCVTANRRSLNFFRWRMDVVGKHHVGVNEHEITEFGVLANVHLAVQLAVVAYGKKSLKVGACTKATMIANARTFPNRDPMSGLKMRSNDHICINDGSAADQRVWPDHRFRVEIVFVSVIG